MKLDDSVTEEIRQIVREVLKADPDKAIEQKAMKAANFVVYGGDPGEE